MGIVDIYLRNHFGPEFKENENIIAANPRLNLRHLLAKFLFLSLFFLFFLFGKQKNCIRSLATTPPSRFLFFRIPEVALSISVLPQLVRLLRILSFNSVTEEFITSARKTSLRQYYFSPSIQRRDCRRK